MTHAHSRVRPWLDICFRFRDEFLFRTPCASRGGSATERVRSRMVTENIQEPDLNQSVNGLNTPSMLPQAQELLPHSTPSWWSI